MTNPGPHGKDKQRCGAKLRGRHGYCKCWPLDGRTRCRLHGGLSTGAKNPEAREQIVAAMVAGRKRWLEEMQQRKAEGKIKRLPMGRRSGAGWKTEAMHQQEWAEMRADRLARQEQEKPPKRRPGRPGKAEVLAKAVAAASRPRGAGLEKFEQDKQAAKLALLKLKQQLLGQF